MTIQVRLFCLLCLLCLLASGNATAGLRDVDFDPQPGTQLPLNVQFHEAGRPVRLEHFFGRAPVVLQLGYFGCINLCSTTLVGAAEALERTGLVAGKDYTALFVSIDPRDEAAPPERRAGWHFLTGAKSAAAVARKIGFKYFFEKETGQYSHPAGFVVLDELGRVSAYFPGVRFDPARLREALLAQGGEPGAFEHLLLVCFHDPLTGRYSESALNALRAVIFAFLAALGWLAWRRL
ncbi:MAG TPA: SCO family protein [Burkholderiales bacterium]|nr:SCO family protein [Burkholderiales bacterium]